MLKGEIPFVGESYDLSKPGKTGSSFVQTAVGLFMLILALMVAAFGAERVQAFLGQDTDDSGLSIEVAN